MNGTDLKHTILETLKSIPIPDDNEIHLCPCFEQIVGAAYGFLAAFSYGIMSRDLNSYHDKVRVKLPGILAQAEELPVSSANPAWATWASGFYFNAAVQRMIWVGDRLLTVFVGLPLTCCPSEPVLPNGPQDIFKRLLPLVRARLNHVHLQASKEQLRGLGHFSDLLDVKFDSKHDHVTATNYLRAIRWDVNQRKHAIGGFHRKSSGTIDNASWASLSQNQQFEYALSAFAATCDLYCSVHHAYFEGKHLNIGA